MTESRGGTPVPETPVGISTSDSAENNSAREQGVVVRGGESWDREGLDTYTSTRDGLQGDDSMSTYGETTVAGSDTTMVEDDGLVGDWRSSPPNTSTLANLEELGEDARWQPRPRTRRNGIEMIDFSRYVQGLDGSWVERSRWRALEVVDSLNDVPIETGIEYGWAGSSQTLMQWQIMPVRGADGSLQRRVLGPTYRQQGRWRARSIGRTEYVQGEDGLLQASTRDPNIAARDRAGSSSNS